MSALQLKKLQADAARFLRRWKLSNKRTAFYKCPDCKKKIETIAPFHREVSRGGFWGSMKTCTKCGGLSFVRVYPSGKTEVLNFEGQLQS